MFRERRDKRTPRHSSNEEVSLVVTRGYKAHEVSDVEPEARHEPSKVVSPRLNTPPSDPTRKYPWPSIEPTVGRSNAARSTLAQRPQ